MPLACSFPGCRFPLGAEVRVKRAPLLRRLLQGRGGRRQGQVGQVLYAQLGEHSEKPLYTLAFKEGEETTMDCYFEDELELYVPEQARLPRWLRPGSRSRVSSLAERVA